MKHIALIAIVGCVLLLPWIDRSFGTTETNPGTYFGPYVRNFESFGLLELKGVPLGVTLLDDPAEGYPYLNHPPALSWILFLFGSAEWQMRLCTTLGLILSSILTYLLLIRSCGASASLLAGLLLMVTPVLTFYSQVSYEPVVMPLGLTMCLAIERLSNARPGRGARRAWTLALALTSLIGPWVDWAYAYYCVALVPLSWESGALKATMRRLLLPALCSITSLGLLLMWRQAVTGLGRADGIFTFSQLFDSSVQSSPSMLDLLSSWSDRIPECFTLPLLVVALFGIQSLWRADRRLAITLWFTGVIHVLVFRGHTLGGHQMFFAYSTIVLATCVALAIVRGPIARTHLTIRLGVTGIVFLWPAWNSLSLIQATTTNFFRDQGAVMSAATGPLTAEEGEGRYLVGWGGDASGGLGYYGYYIDSPRVRAIPIDTAEALTAGVQRMADELGARYLWIRLEDARGNALVDDSDFEELFASFDKVRHPELEVELDLTGRGYIVRVREAWLVTLRHPGS